MSELTQDDGLDYIFTIMSATYGAMFMRHWEGLDFVIVRETWKKKLGDYLTYKSALDYSLSNLPPRYVPTLMEFFNLCREFGPIPRDNAIDFKPEEVSEEDRARMALLAEQAREFIFSYTKRARGSRK